MIVKRPLFLAGLGGEHDGASFTESSEQRVGDDVPNDGDYLLVAEPVDRWEPGLSAGASADSHGWNVTRTMLQLNLVVSLLSLPKPNKLYIELELPRPQRVRFLLAEGSYDPLLTSIPTHGWIELDAVDAPAGRSLIEFQIPEQDLRRVVYPTNFKKHIAGRNYNAYHFVHLDALRRLGQRYGDAIFMDYAERWAGYVAGWPNHPAYQGRDIAFNRYAPPPREVPEPED